MSEEISASTMPTYDELDAAGKARVEANIAASRDDQTFLDKQAEVVEADGRVTLANWHEGFARMLLPQLLNSLTPNLNKLVAEQIYALSVAQKKPVAEGDQKVWALAQERLPLTIQTADLPPNFLKAILHSHGVSVRTFLESPFVSPVDRKEPMSLANAQVNLTAMGYAIPSLGCGRV